jgi:hypothetical protein
MNDFIVMKFLIVSILLFLISSCSVDKAKPSNDIVNTEVGFGVLNDKLDLLQEEILKKQMILIVGSPPETFLSETFSEEMTKYYSVKEFIDSSHVWSDGRKKIQFEYLNLSDDISYLDKDIMLSLSIIKLDILICVINKVARYNYSTQDSVSVGG